MDLTKITSRLLAAKFTMTAIDKGLLRATSKWKGTSFEVEVTPKEITFKPLGHASVEWLKTFTTHADMLAVGLVA